MMLPSRSALKSSAPPSNPTTPLRPPASSIAPPPSASRLPRHLPPPCHMGWHGSISPCIPMLPVFFPSSLPYIPLLLIFFPSSLLPSIAFERDTMLPSTVMCGFDLNVHSPSSLRRILVRTDPTRPFVKWEARRRVQKG